MQRALVRAFGLRAAMSRAVAIPSAVLAKKTLSFATVVPVLRCYANAASLARSKRPQEQLARVAEAIPAVKNLACSKNFVESVDVSVHLNVDPRKADQVRAKCYDQ